MVVVAPPTVAVVVVKNPESTDKEVAKFELETEAFVDVVVTHVLTGSIVVHTAEPTVTVEVVQTPESTEIPGVT